MDTKEYIEQQEIEERVIEKIQQRRDIGMKKYGVSVKDNPLKLSEWLNHLQEELLDASIYVEKLKDATTNLPPDQYIEQKVKEVDELWDYLYTILTDDDEEVDVTLNKLWSLCLTSIKDSFNQGHQEGYTDGLNREHDAHQQELEEARQEGRESMRKDAIEVCEKEEQFYAKKKDIPNFGALRKSEAMIIKQQLQKL